MAKNLSSLIFIFLGLTSCQSLRTSHQPAKPYQPQIVSPQNPVTQSTITPTAQIVTPQIVVPQTNQGSAVKGVPKFGIIFSAGGAKTWAEIGALKEMQKFKFPVVSVAGIEWGAVIGAVFAQNVSANEVEWELSKFKDIDDWQDFIKVVFAKKNTTDFKIPFVCPSLNLKNKTSYMLNRGQVDQFLPFCVPSAGITKPFGSSVANLSDIQLVAQHLKATGVSRVILINVLTSKNDSALIKSIDSPENQIWAQYEASLGKKSPLIDDVIDIDLSDYKIDDFDKRRDIMVKGSELSYPLIKKLAEKYRL